MKRGGALIDHVGVSGDRAPRRLVFTWGVDAEQGDLSVVTIEITRAARVRPPLTHRIDPAWADYAERTRQGWTFMVGKLADALG